MAEELESTMREVRDELLSEPVSPRVDEPADINLHYCRYVAETVVERMEADGDLEILEDGGRGFVHTWISHDGRHFDAECVEGVPDYRELPFFQRHPEAAVHVEPATADPASLRQRGKEPLYPDIFNRGSSRGYRQCAKSSYRLYALVGILLGSTLVLIGLSGEWAIHHHLLRTSSLLRRLFVDIELIGELLLLISPILFFVLLPAQHRADSL